MSLMEKLLIRLLLLIRGERKETIIVTFEKETISVTGSLKKDESEYYYYKIRELFIAVMDRKIEED